MQRGVTRAAMWMDEEKVRPGERPRREGHTPCDPGAGGRLRAGESGVPEVMWGGRTALNCTPQTVGGWDRSQHLDNLKQPDSWGPVGRRGGMQGPAHLCSAPYSCAGLHTPVLGSTHLSSAPHTCEGSTHLCSAPHTCAQPCHESLLKSTRPQSLGPLCDKWPSCAPCLELCPIDHLGAGGRHSRWP